MEQVTWELKSAAEAWFIYGSHCLSMEFLLAYVWFLLIEEAGQIWACANSLDHLDCSHGAMAVFYFRKEFLSPSMKVVWTCTCANSFDHLDFIFGSRSQNQDEFSVNFVLRWKFIFFFCRGSCLNLELAQILLIIWIAVVTVVHWQYFISGRKTLTENKGSCWNSQLVQFLLIIWIADCDNLF